MSEQRSNYCITGHVILCLAVFFCLHSSLTSHPAGHMDTKNSDVTKSDQPEMKVFKKDLLEPQRKLVEPKVRERRNEYWNERRIQEEIEQIDDPKELEALQRALDDRKRKLLKIQLSKEDKPAIEDYGEKHSGKPVVDDFGELYADIPVIDDYGEPHADKPVVDDYSETYADKPVIYDNEETYTDTPFIQDYWETYTDTPVIQDYWETYTDKPVIQENWKTNTDKPVIQDYGPEFSNVPVTIYDERLNYNDYENQKSQLINEINQLTIQLNVKKGYRRYYVIETIGNLLSSLGIESCDEKLRNYEIETKNLIREEEGQLDTSFF